MLWFQWKKRNNMDFFSILMLLPIILLKRIVIIIFNSKGLAMPDEKY